MSVLHRKLRRDVRRHRAQFGAVAVTMFLGISLFAASYDSFRNLTASYDETATRFRFADLTVAGGDIPTFAAAAAADPGVGAVTTRTVADVPLRIGATKFLGRVVGVPAGSQPAVNRLLVETGEWPAGTGVLAEEHLSDHFGLEVGDELEALGPAGWVSLTVAGAAASPEYIWPARDRTDFLPTPDNFGVVFAAEALARELAGGGPTEAVVTYTASADVGSITAVLTDLAVASGAIDVYPRSEQASNAALSEDLQGFGELSLFFPILFLSAAGMAAYVTITRLVHAQRAQIGMLLAGGFTRRRVLRHYLGYGLVPGLLGAVPGAVAGVALGQVVTRLYVGFLAIPVTVIRLYPTTLLLAVGLGMLASLAAAAAPALVAARVAPAEAMRGMVPAGPGRRSLLERLVPPARRLPVRWRMTLRGIERNPRRTAYTVVGVVLSLMLILVSWGMIDTVSRLMDRQFNEIQQEDATVRFTGPVAPDRIARLAAVPGVAAVEPGLEVPVAVATAAGRYETIMIALDAGTEMRRFYGPAGSPRPLPARGLLAGTALAGALELEEGDPVDLTVAGVPGTFPTVVAGFVREPLGTLVYASRDDLAALTGVDIPATAAWIRYAPGADTVAMRSAITDLAEVAAFEDARALFDTYQEFLVLFYAFVGVMLAFGGTMAFALVFNSMSVNIAERRREVGTMLAVGAGRTTVSRLISAENLLVAVAAIPLGLVAGYWTARYAMASFESEMFAFDLYVAPTTYVAAAIAILVVAAVSQLPGLRALRRLDIPAIVKERST